ncbi:hypothetical protein TNCV_3371441 [Trichonephila clavipes]|nr:hypothetical protein TNCV_3371441 [Trichonephila clavipes]
MVPQTDPSAIEVQESFSSSQMGMKIHPDKTRSYVQCKHCPDLQLTPNAQSHLGMPNRRNKVTKNGNGLSEGLFAGTPVQP